MDRFTVATFNLYNFQLPGLRMNPFQKPWTKAEFDKKVSWIARMLETIDADVIGLQELWHAEAMQAVLAREALKDKYDLLATPATGTKIVCGALLRKGLLRGTPEWVSEFPEALRLEAADELDPQAPAISVHLPGWSRPVLHFQASFRDDAAPVEVFVTHLKSKLPTQVNGETWYEADPELYRNHRNALGAAISTIRRTAEAAALRVLLTEVMKGTETPVLVLGDLNDGKESNTIDILTEQPSYLVGDSEGGADIGLYTAQTLQEYRDTRDVYYTHVHQAMRESLDHVLVSEQLYDHSLRRTWLFDELVIYNDHLNAEDHKETGTTDHGIVRVSFKYKPYARATS